MVAHRAQTSAAVAVVAAILTGCAGSAHPPTGSIGIASERGGSSSASSASAVADPVRTEGLAFVSAGQVWRVDGGVARRLTQSPETKRSLAYSPDRSQLLFVSGDGMKADIMSLPLGSGSLNLLHATGESSLVGAVRRNPATGEVLYTYYGDPYTLIRRVAENGTKLPPVRTAVHTNGDFDVASDGRLVYTSFDQAPARVSVRGARGEHPLSLKLALATEPSFSADGKRVVLSGASSPTGPRSVWVVELASGESTQLRSTMGLEPQTPVFSPDGSRVAFRNARDGSLWLVPILSGAPERLGLPASDGAIAW